MKAAEARELKVGDYVMGCFGNVSKRCRIIGISWPNFSLEMKDYKGEPMFRERLYRSLWKATPPKERPAPRWLKWPEAGQDSESGNGRQNGN